MWNSFVILFDSFITTSWNLIPCKICPTSFFKHTSWWWKTFSFLLLLYKKGALYKSFHSLYYIDHIQIQTCGRSNVPYLKSNLLLQWEIKERARRKAPVVPAEFCVALHNARHLVMQIMAINFLSFFTPDKSIRQWCNQ